MARKSRKNIVPSGIVKNKTLKAVGYIRLSVTKIDTPSDSIENQKKIIQDFVNNRSDITLEYFYIDQKSSGTKFECKAFNEMIENINNGNVHCVIVKDLSRLGRSLIDVGCYIEQYFPSKKVRFISVSDRFETLDGITNFSFEKMWGIKIPITTLLDEQYVLEISRKTQSVIDSFVHGGKYVAPRAPYGYKKCEADCHKLVTDKDSASIVQEIFSLALKKVSINEIVRLLNNRKIPSPMTYAVQNGLQGNYNPGNGLWNSRTVKDILSNITYTGNLRQGKNDIVVENTHESIISREDFNQVQTLLSSTNPKGNMTNVPRADNMLRGKVICGCCCAKMQRRKGSGMQIGISSLASAIIVLAQDTVLC